MKLSFRPSRLPLVVSVLALLTNGLVSSPVRAESVLPEGEWKVIQKSPGLVTTKIIRAESQPGGNSEALEVTVKEASDPFYALALSKEIPTAVKAGIRVRLRFWARSATKNPMRAVVEFNGAPFTAVAEATPTLTPQWLPYQAVGTTETVFAPGKMAVRLQVGHQAGVIEIAGVTLDTLGPDVALAAARAAIKPEAVRARIDAIRKGDLTITVRDANGKPRSDVTITIKQTKSAFLFGCNLFELDSAKTDPLQAAYQQRFTDLFNFATLPFYWGAFEAERGKPDYERLTAMADWGVAHGLTLKGHPLVWHEVYPNWGPKTADETIPLLEDRIFDLIPRYKGKIRLWDVANEVTVARNTDTGIGEWARRNGPVAVVQQSLRWARAANKEAKATLLYNDFNLGLDLTNLLTTLKQRDALPDAIGIQSHMHDKVWPLENVWMTVEEYGAFKRPVHFTEITVVSGPRPAKEEKDQYGGITNWPTTPEGEKAQADYLARFYAILFSNPKVEAITYWDLSDKNAWQGAPAGLLRADMTPKPAYDRLKKLLRTEWRTNLVGKPNPQGIYKTRAFFGDYEVTISDKSGRKTVNAVTLPIGQSAALSLTL